MKSASYRGTGPEKVLKFSAWKLLIALPGEPLESATLHGPTQFQARSPPLPGRTVAQSLPKRGHCFTEGRSRQLSAFH